MLIRDIISPTVLREAMDPGDYGGWIDARTGKVTLIDRGSTHMQTAVDKLGVISHVRANSQEFEFDYPAAYAHHLVRFVSDSYPIAFGISGFTADIYRTFKVWYPAAAKADVVYVDVEDTNEGHRYEMHDPRDKVNLRQGFGPQTASESEVWDEPNPKSKHDKLSPSDKAAAKTRARRAGRRYPNLIDNMWASRR